MSIDSVTGAGGSVNNSPHLPSHHPPNGLSLNTVAKVIRHLLLITAIDSIIAWALNFLLLRDLYIYFVLYFSSKGDGAVRINKSRSCL
jgi:hypothetical protein